MNLLRLKIFTNAITILILLLLTFEAQAITTWSADKRFKDSGDQTILDTKTGLIWMKEDSYLQSSHWNNWFESTELIKQTNKNGGLAVNPQTGTSTFYIDQINPQAYYTIEKMDVGEISLPVPAQSIDGRKGYRIIKLLRKSEPHKASLDTDYDKVQGAALANKQNEATMQWIKGKVGSTYVKIGDEFSGCNFENEWVK